MAFLMADGVTTGMPGATGVPSLTSFTRPYWFVTRFSISVSRKSSVYGVVTSRNDASAAP